MVLLRLLPTAVTQMSKVGSRFTPGLRSRIFGIKSNRRKTSTNLNGLNCDRLMGQTNDANNFIIYNISLHYDIQF